MSLLMNLDLGDYRIAGSDSHLDTIGKLIKKVESKNSESPDLGEIALMPQIKLYLK